MTTQNVSQRQMTVVGFKQEMAAFIEHMKGVVTPNTETGRALFPDFKVTDQIKEKLRGAADLLAEGDLRGAFDVFDGTTEHFQNQQAGYAKRTLLQQLKSDLTFMKKEWLRNEADRDLAVCITKAVEEYETLVSSQNFNLADVSKLFWKTNSELNRVEDEFKSRVAERTKEAANRKKEQQAAENKAAIARAKQRCASTASDLRKLVTSI